MKKIFEGKLTNYVKNILLKYKSSYEELIFKKRRLFIEETGQVVILS